MFRLLSCISLLLISDSGWAKSSNVDPLHWVAGQLKSSGGYVYSQSVVSDEEGNVYVTGSFKGTADFDPGPGTAVLTSAGDSDIFLAKYDVSGNYVFAKRMGNSGRDEGVGLAMDGQENIYLAGNFYYTIDVDPGKGTANLSSAGASDVFYLKLNKKGEYLSAKRMGGNNVDWVTGMSVDYKGNIYMCGFFYRTIYFDPANPKYSLTSAKLKDKDANELPDVFMVHFDDYGSYQYANRLSGEIASVCLSDDNAGEIFVTGSFRGTVDFDPGTGIANRTSLGHQDIFIARYDHWGDFRLAKTIGSEHGNDVPNSIVATGGDIYLTGMFGGQTSWDNFYSLRATIDFDPSNNTAALTSAGRGDAFIAKYDQWGNYIFAKRLGDEGPDKGTKIAVDVFGNIYVMGDFSYSVDFDPGAGKSEFSSFGINDVFLAKYDGNGNFLFSKTMGTSEWDDPLCFAIQKKGLNPVNAIYQIARFKGPKISCSADPKLEFSNPTNEPNTLIKYDGSGKRLFVKPFAVIN